MKRYYKPVLACAGAALVAWFLLWMIIANPFNFFVHKSDRFSSASFRTIKPGTPISSAISLLGNPIEVMPLAPDADCFNCSIYYFMGNPAPWLVGFEEAWLIVDAKGTVVQAVEHSEP